MYKEIKKQIQKQTREQLNHVRVPQQPGITFGDSGGRITYGQGNIRYNRKLFVLQRGDNFILSKQLFELYGGANIFSMLNGATDGGLIDNYLPAWANVEYSTSFVPNKDGAVSLPYELTDNSVASVFVMNANNDIVSKYTLSKLNGRLTLNLTAGEQIKIFIYYYNYNNAINTYGGLSIFAGLAEHVASWSYIDVTPPSKPVWHTVALLTEAADPGAATTKVTLQFEAPVTWPQNWDNLSEEERLGILNDPDLAGHNIYRVSANVINTDTVEFGDPDESPNTIIYSGNNIDQFIHGQAIYSTGTSSLFAAMQHTTTPDIGSVTVEESGVMRFRGWANFTETDAEQKIYNNDFEIAVHGYVPSGWTFSGGGFCRALYADRKVGYYCYLSNISGTSSVAQYVDIERSHQHRLDFAVENISSGTGYLFIKKGTEIMASSVFSGTGSYNSSLYFNSPMNTGVYVEVMSSGETDLNIFNLNLYDINHGAAIECASYTRNYIVNGGFEAGYSGWTTINISDATWDTALFGYKTPTFYVNSGCGIIQVTTIPDTQGAMLSAYLNVYSGSVNVQRLGGTPTLVTQTSGWLRRAQYTPSGYGTVVITAAEDNTIFALDGVQLEAQRRLTSFDDINIDGVTERQASFVKYSGVNHGSNEGTIRIWFTPSWKSIDYANPADLKYVWCIGASPTIWTFGYNGFMNNFELITISGANFGQIGVPYYTDTRHVPIHLVCCWSGSAAEIWVNGVKGVIDEGDYTNRNIHHITDNVLYVGGYPGAGNNSADGTLEGLVVDTKKWSPGMIIADYNGSTASITDTLVTRNTIYRKGNLIVNSNLATRNSLTDLYGWSLTTGGTVTMAADYSKPKLSDVSLKITT